MPHRTNPFQYLMTQIQAALHGKKAKVEESAMVYNYDSQTKTEVDILITFEIGSTSYRTAIECQDRSRPAGTSWISELKTKRDGCRLDKIIAIHSKGFTDSAKTMAEKYGIEILTPKNITEKDKIFEKINPYTRLAFQISKCKFPEGIVFSFEKGILPKKAEPDSSNLIFPDRSMISINEFEKALREIVRSFWIKKEYDLAETTFNQVEEKEINENILVQVSFLNGAKLNFTDGTCLSVISAKADGEITLKTMVINKLNHISPKNSIIATHGEVDLLGKKASLTLTKQEDKKGEMGICIVWEGGTVNVRNQIDKRLIGNIKIMIKKI